MSTSAPRPCEVLGDNVAGVGGASDEDALAATSTSPSASTSDSATKRSGTMSAAMPIRAERTCGAGADRGDGRAGIGDCARSHFPYLLLFRRGERPRIESGSAHRLEQSGGPR